MTELAGGAAARAMARRLAPYIAEELGLGAPAPRSAAYDAETCRVYVEGLGASVVARAETMFGLLADPGKVGSLQLAAELGVSSPRALSGILTTALKRRAAALGLEPPWRVTEDAEERTVWHDRDGIASRMRAAMQAEISRRDE